MRVPNYLWGEAVRNTTYLLNRVATRVLKEKTPYEALRGRKPNLSHIRVFGCIGYAKTVKPHLKKLEDRSRMLVHLGTEPGSKAYRMFDPQDQKVVVSRDVVFDEAKGWNWSQNQTNQHEAGSFKIAIGTYGNRGIHGTVESKAKIDEETVGNEEAEHHDIIRSTSLGNGTEGDEEEMETETTLRRSQRQITKPKYLEDYVLYLAEEEGEILLMVLNDEPRNFSEAKRSKD